MSVNSAPYYWLECDFPGCGVHSTEEGEFSAWVDSGQAREEAENSEWLCTDDGDYCPTHIVIREYDEEQEDANGDWSTELRFPMEDTLANRFALANMKVRRLIEDRAHQAYLRIHKMHHGNEDRLIIDNRKREQLRPVRASTLTQVAPAW